MGDGDESAEGLILTIEGEHVALGPLRRELIPLYQRWMNNLGTMRTLDLTPYPITMEKEQDWYERVSRAESDVSFTIYERETLRPIGNTGLHEVDYRNRTASFGIIIGEPECRGKGYGTETTRLMLDYAFTALGLHNVMLIVFEFNAAGIKAYKKAGFKEFGRRRECRLVGGKMWDEIQMDCLSTEFESTVLRRIYAPDDAKSHRRAPRDSGDLPRP